MKQEIIDKFHNLYLSNAYEYLGAKISMDNNSAVVTFRVYCPNADGVSVVGDFNNWNSSAHQMNKISSKGLWEIKIKNLTQNSKYKYCIFNKGKTLYKQDPYSFYNETEGETCSYIYDFPNFQFNDQSWLEKRTNSVPHDKAINIYEVHLGSWKKDNNHFYNYRQLADELIPYVIKMGYTHLEIMPITEYPYGGSWGYQVTGYFSPTSRFGKPEDFMYLVNKAHENNIGIILDWVPAHFPKDKFALYEYDGGFVYENPDSTKMEHENWGTRIFNYSKPEVMSFLISSAMFFFEKYHIDGLRVDAVASMIYLDYDRKIWMKNKNGDNYHLEAIEFIRELNKSVFEKFPNVLMIAEESTAFPKVTASIAEGGLGFNFKWNMGWMNDTLFFMKTDPLFRKSQHHRITFSMSYAFSEKYILPISHDEVVHGKKSLLNKMPGNYEQKFANVRAFYGLMMTHPGKKLNFMGYEFGQFIEWNETKELDWLLLDFPAHNNLFSFIREMNHFYLNNPPLWEIDYSWDGFKWLSCDDCDNNCLSYIRTDKNNNQLLIVINFSGTNQLNYKVKYEGIKLIEVFNSDKKEYGGTNITNQAIKKSDGANDVEIQIAALSFIIFKILKE